MNRLLDLLGKDSLKVAHLEQIYAVHRANEDFVTDAISALDQLDSDVSWRAIWLLKRHALERGLSDSAVSRIADVAEGLTDWASRLNLCQLLAATGCPAQSRETLYPYLVACFGNRRPMIRAWAISVLAGFRADTRFRKPVKALLRQAQADPAGSIQARLRRLGIKPSTRVPQRAKGSKREASSTLRSPRTRRG